MKNIPNLRINVPQNTRPWLVLAIAGVAVLGGCSERRQDGEVQSASVSDSSYQYPHAASWSTQHVEFVSSHGNEVAGSSKDCTRCHTPQDAAAQQMRTTGSGVVTPMPTPRPLNVSCAMACHNPQIDGPSTTLPSHPVSPNNECVKCHAGHMARKKPHYPAAAGLCKTCHDVTPQHLVGTGPAGATTRSSDQTCYTCHSRMDRRTHVHAALTLDKDRVVTKYACSNCHDAHGSEQRYFLKQATVETLCSSCHDMSSATHKSIHGALKNERSCLSCHNPHSSEQKKLLLVKGAKELCLSCHDREIPTRHSADPRVIPNIKDRITNMPFTHSPARRDDGCIDCHNPHASKFDRLTTDAYPGDSYARYTPASGTTPNTYALCFGCHDVGLLNKDITDMDTGFRDDRLVNGKVVRKNLHWFHVVDAAGSANKDNGRSCYICHDPHGAQQIHNIKSQWRMSPSHSVRIEYAPMPNGGTCTKSCHDQRVYKRAED